MDRCLLIKMLHFVLWILLFSMAIDASWMTTRECDEELTGPIGVLQFQDPYKELKSWTFYCEYNVTVRETKNILVTISSLSMNSPENACGDSYITLKDGFEQSSPLLGPSKYCRSNQLVPYVTTGNQLNIRTAIELGLGAHYTLKYQENSLTCGGIFELTPETLSQRIESPNFSNSSSLSECTWIFIAPVDHVLSMNFTLFNSSLATNCEEEYVEIKDGGTSVSPLISQVCSKSENKILTTDTLLYIKFHSNNVEPLIFFRADIIAVKNTCGGILRTDSGTIISPNYPFNSPNGICTWKIIAPSKKRIVFQFHDLHLSNSLNCEQGNYLRMSENFLEKGTDRIFGTFCGFTRPSIIKTSCNRATIEFHSDYHNIGHFRGFVLNFTTIDESCVVNCGGILTSDNGIISSPNFPNNYQSNQHCEWKIALSKGKKIKLQFFRLMINTSPTCNEDYLRIMENIEGTDKTLGIYCGFSNPMPIMTSGSVAKVIFHSDNENEDSGFLLTYTAVEETPPHHNILCDREFREPTGIITSPNYPNNCPASIKCVYKIIQPPGTIIMMNVTNIQFSSTKTNEIAIWDSNDDSKFVATLYHNAESYLPQSFNSSTNFLYVTFKTGNQIQGCKGFNAIYKTFDRKCGGILTEPRGTIKSPNHPSPYGVNERCLWIIKAPPGQVIMLTWSSFKLEGNNYDTVQLTQINQNGLYEVAGRYSGDKIPPPMITHKNILEIKFHSDHTFSFSGFSANYAFMNASTINAMNFKAPKK